jgi:predicted PurR-regulated permease PerM
MKQEEGKKKKKRQSKVSCFLESLSNEAIGYAINTTIQVLIFPLFGIFLSLSVNMATSGVHSFFGLLRIYVVRRLFSRLGKKQSKRSSFIECIEGFREESDPPVKCVRFS